MRRAPRSPRPHLERRREAGGLLIVLMVGVAVIFIGLSVAVQSWSVVWRRDSEEELIFRGGQYVLAIVAYQADHNGQFPTDLEILSKEGPRRLHYIRKLYRDPINPRGQWGLLYLMPGGNAIYDPVAAQKGKGGDGNATDALGGAQGGVTPIGDLSGTGLGQPPGGPGVPNRSGGPNTGPNKAPGSGSRFSAPIGAGSFTGGALPPPKPATGSFDEKSPSEPPIGWPIVGVISRADDRLSAKTFKIYKGHDKVNEWQFHVFDGTLIPTAPATIPGGSPAPFRVGPGYGGPGGTRGPLFGGPGAKPNPGGNRPNPGPNPNNPRGGG